MFEDELSKIKTLGFKWCFVAFKSCFKSLFVYWLCRSVIIRSCSIGINRFRLFGMVWFCRVLLEKTVLGWCGRSTSSTGIKLQQVETVEKGWAALSFSKLPHWLQPYIVFPQRVTRRSLVMTIPRSYSVSTENGWKSAFHLRHLNRFNLN